MPVEEKGLDGEEEKDNVDKRMKRGWNKRRGGFGMVWGRGGSRSKG